MAKSSGRLPHSVYLAYFTVAAKAVRAAGFETLPGGGIFARQEMDRLDEWCESGKPAEAFAEWIIHRRIEEQRQADALAGENIGDETIHPSQAA